jgi:hypothetical protein
MLIPAAVITCIKGHWAMLVAGFLTFGIVWFIGAASRGLYEPRRSRRETEIAVAALLAAVLVLGLFGVRPAPFLGYGGKQLEDSVGGGGILGFNSSCVHRRDGDWNCFRIEDGGSSDVEYRVHANEFGCWHVVPRGPAARRGGPSPPTGCIGLIDY